MKKILTLFICSIAAYNASAQTIANGGMETWKTYSSLGTSMQRPDQWTSSDSLNKLLTISGGILTYTAQVTKETSVVHGGTTAAKLVTMKQSSAGDTLPGAIVNAKVNVDLSTFDFSFSGGTPVSSRIASGSFWAHYVPTAPSDSATLTVLAIKTGFGTGGTDSTIGMGFVNIGTNPGYSQITANIDYNDATTVPDHIIVYVSSSRADEGYLPGSTLYADDFTLSTTTGIETPVFNSSSIKVYPNPATDRLHVSNTLNEAVLTAIYTISGQLVLTSRPLYEGDINISTLPAGNYIYVLSGAQTGAKQYSAAFTKK